jgi:hypothetical protein
MGYTQLRTYEIGGNMPLINSTMVYAVNIPAIDTSWEERERQIGFYFKKPCVFPERRPHLCPVCDGKGKILEEIAEHLEPIDKPTKPCHACGGRGIIIC